MEALPAAGALNRERAVTCLATRTTAVVEEVEEGTSGGRVPPTLADGGVAGGAAVASVVAADAIAAAAAHAAGAASVATTAHEVAMHEAWKDKKVGKGWDRERMRGGGCVRRSENVSD